MYKKYVLAALLGAVAIIMPSKVGAQREAMIRRDPVPMPEVSIDTLIGFVRELSSEDYEGRMAGTVGYERAANYVARVMEGYGLEVTVQQFGVECNEVENCKFNVYQPGDHDKRVFTLGSEFCCTGATGRGYVDAQMVFCGWGIDWDGFDEYAEVDVQGKIAVVLTGLPENHRLPTWVAERGSNLRDKARVAERHGAIGMLAVNVSPSCLSGAPQAKVYCGELPHMPTFPMLQLTMDCAREIFAGQKMEIDAAIDSLRDMERTHSFALLKKAEIDVNARYRQAAPTYNVVGILEGSEQRYRKEYIVMGASLDGAGMQGETCLFPSADINGSGVAAVLETARLLSQPEYRPKRSVVFVLFGAGEQQYLGSRRFVEMFGKQRRIEAFVGVQNIGYGDSIVLMGGARYPTLYDVAYNRDTLSGRHNVMTSLPMLETRGDGRVFDAIRLPALVITTHNGMNNNHVATDIWENIDRRPLRIAAQLATETVAELAEGLYMGRGPQSKGYRYGLIQY